MKTLIINMLLKKLINPIPKTQDKINIKGLSSNSKKIQKDFIFFAIRGHRFNGEKYIKEAINNGAVVVICSKKCKYVSKKAIIIKTSNIRFLLSEISSKFYKLKPKNIIAVTGTNGKTSVADLFYQILNLNGVPVASIGTLGIKYKNKIIKSNLTSPDTIFLHKSLETIKKNKINSVILETSSHGLHQKRVNHINFKAGIFTNFSQDHLDYHKTMRSYLNCKLILFNKLLKKKNKVISNKSVTEFNTIKKISKKRKLGLIDTSLILKKLKDNKNLKLNDFQLINLSMAIAAAKLCKLNEKKIFSILHKIKDVDGRLELVRTFSNNIRVYVDFAHTPDALLKTLKSFKDKSVSLVFGCGGERDFKKRPLMAKIASLYCKKIYVTDDNPRNEKPEKIRKEITKSIRNKTTYDIGNRMRAIKTAIVNADPDEIILVAGKGHESEQIYKNKIIQISDKKIIKNIKLKIKKISDEKENFIENKRIFCDLKKGSKIKDFHGLAIDSRVTKKNNLFLTIKGKKNDGLKFISHALKKGAKHIISSKKLKKFKNKLIKVDNEINFLNSFAAKKRDSSKAKVIAITGSAGKTSLKDLVKKLLQSFGETFCSPKSYNNHFGVPLSLSHLKKKHNYGIFELGMSKAGEINRLSKIIKPHIGIITNIGEAHIENFKNLKGIADAKGEIINNIQKGGTLILNHDDKYFAYLKKKAQLKRLKVISFGLSKKSNVCPLLKLKKSNKREYILRIMDQKEKLEIKNINIYNVLSSLALLKELNLNFKKIITRYKSLVPTEGRGKIHNIKRYQKKFKLIDESYNANPLSVRNAIRNFNSIKKDKFKKYLLLGDMLELGKKSDVLHKNISKVINNSDIDKVFVKGNKSLVTFRNIIKEKRGNIFQQDEDMDFTLNNIIANNDYLMIKGSNATGLNILSKRIIKGI